LETAIIPKTYVDIWVTEDLRDLGLRTSKSCDHILVILSRILQRHAIPMQAHFEFVLVLTYAVPCTNLQTLLPPGLTLDSWNNYGFVAIAMVQTRNMRPAFAPSIFGKDFFLSGYRIFTRFKTRSGRSLRGLRILRSDTDSDLMVRWGNRLTHYGYRKADIDLRRDNDMLDIKILTPSSEADLHVRAHLSVEPDPLPQGSPFPDVQTARRFAGPLPFTFDYEPETNSIIRVQGVRQDWNPRSTRAEVLKNSFIEKEPFASGNPILASAFHIADVPYRWKRGIRETLGA
jgi:hypothetical protein